MLERLTHPLDDFAPRHLGSGEEAVVEMLESLGYQAMDRFIEDVVPDTIRSSRPLDLPAAAGERSALARLRRMVSANRVARSFLGLGYHGTVTPPVILRNVLENPGWYTQYTPYQAEISQGRLEALLNFQTMVSELTALPLANASLLDEATAAAEAMTMCRAVRRRAENLFLVSPHCHPQTLEVLRTRAGALGLTIREEVPTAETIEAEKPFGVLVQFPTTEGRVLDYSHLAAAAEAAGSALVVAADLLALTLLRPPGEIGAHVAIGSTQRFGVPLGFGGPHAAYLAAHPDFERAMPGRIAGVSVDARGNTAYRLARQTREQHIRRERATSNICTAQVLPALLAAFYAIYHGPEGLKRIARRVQAATRLLARGLESMGAPAEPGPVFDTLRVDLGEGPAAAVLAAARTRGINLRDFGDGSLGIALDETVTRSDVEEILAAFAEATGGTPDPLETLDETEVEAEVLPPELRRSSPFLTQQVFHRYHTEHELLRYLFHLQGRDLSLAQSMIPLGSCTMKLNATAEMIPITWPEVADLHPFAPPEQAEGYAELFRDLESWLGEITGFPAVSLQPNAGSQGEYAGLLVIRAYHRSRGDDDRSVCLIPTSAHGTNPASAAMAGLQVVPVECDLVGNIDLEDLEAKASRHRDQLAALMVTYPSTHGVFETGIRRICEIVHENGGQVYLDGANLNAQVGLCRPAEYGADVCHLNLHKTFCIPHGGGGPGMGPICVAEHLAPFLPGHPLREVGGERAIGAVSAAPWGSPGILPISWMYIAMMGGAGLTRASELAMLNANYMAERLANHYPILYRGATGRVAHEFILDLRGFKKSADVTVDDVAKRLMDFGFHAPTMSWPVAGTMMVEPTESESKAELDRFCDAMIAIRDEIREIEEGRATRDDNLLRNAPHTVAEVTSDGWSRPYSRERAAYPAPWLRDRKFWPPVSRIDNAFGDRNLVCTCDPVASYADAELDAEPAAV